MQIPLDKNVDFITDIPYTLSFVIRKRVQIDSLNEMPKDKRPPELMIWDGTSDEIESWIDKVYDRKDNTPDGIYIDIKDDEIEG
ncbi:hypothetical protein LCGC14_1288780 [marine sediment metagenome]|uniref:Uncharacterized protein n=1 Tax=marine sediment metagenome TaxID=412755 RepID=A0A0F9N9M3_9ZZZZ